MHAKLGITGPQRLVLRLVGHHTRLVGRRFAERALRTVRPGDREGAERVLQALADELDVTEQ